ncbi:MAG: response regulator [Myxococcota bacterium]|nr:response regulator [Myxococcota bacterium]
MDRGRRILVIDDSEIMLERIKRALESKGYEVLATTQLVGNARYLPTCDLVIIDYHMPGLNGASVLDSMRALTATMKNACPLFVYTSDRKIASAHAELGFDGALAAKGDEQALVRQLATLFRTLDMRAERERRTASRPATLPDAEPAGQKPRT